MLSTEKDNESLIKQYWRPLMAYQYFAVCLFDFIIFPALTMIVAKYTGEYVQWNPITLKESGFYHMAMGAIVGVAAWTRGLEKVRRIGRGRDHHNDEDLANMRGN